MTRRRILLAGVLLAGAAWMLLGCGVKGPPKPPKTPIARGS